MNITESINNKNANFDTKGKKQCTLIMKNGFTQGNVTVIDGITHESPIMLAGVEVKIHESCCHPCVRLDYSASIDFSSDFNDEDRGTQATFTVTIFRNYNKNKKVPIESRIYSREYTFDLLTGGRFTFGIGTTDSFGFSAFDHEALPGESYVYTAEIVYSELTPRYLSGEYPTVLVNNSVLSALVAG